MNYIWSAFRTWLRGDLSRILGDFQIIADKLQAHIDYHNALADAKEAVMVDMRAEVEAHDATAAKAAAALRGLDNLLGN